MSPRTDETAAMDSIQDLGFIPCAATSTRLLYARGSSIICRSRNSLEIARIFNGHEHKVLQLSVNNDSPGNPSHRVASLDESGRLLIWNLNTGKVLYNADLPAPAVVVAWMRHDCVAIGMGQGRRAYKV
jgi:hypothetical protein